MLSISFYLVMLLGVALKDQQNPMLYFPFKMGSEMPCMLLFPGARKFWMGDTEGAWHHCDVAPTPYPSLPAVRRLHSGRSPLTQGGEADGGGMVVK